MFRPLPPLPNLEDLLLRLIAQIPRGRVSTCGQLAEALGSRLAARWVGHFLLHHEHGPTCPCHRVVRADGSLGGFAAGDEEKIRRLRCDGVAVDDQRIDLARFAWSDFDSPRPLVALQAAQESLVRTARLVARNKLPPCVGGVDVSYPSQYEGVAGFALVDASSGKLLWSTTIRQPVRFPYITSFLAFRELPILLSLLEQVHRNGKMPEVLLVDGSGMLHQRHAGIATHLGVVANLATIGVTKSLLCGRPEKIDLKAREACRVLLDDQVVGVAVRPTNGSRRPLYISPGHRVNLSFCQKIVLQLLKGRRLPEPLYWADRLSRAAGRE